MRDQVAGEPLEQHVEPVERPDMTRGVEQTMHGYASPEAKELGTSGWREAVTGERDAHETLPVHGEGTARGQDSVAAEDSAAAAPGGAALPDGETALTATVPLDELRSLVLRAYPDALPELVYGETLAELLARAEQAVALRERLLAQAPAANPPVAAGAPRRADAGDVARLSPLEKLLRGIASRGA
ncbi:hypothetical protein HRbin28_00160 [bacterium HR28]|nr:hypothetical protein HRbin28_00160 [bacterium HR28]